MNHILIGGFFPFLIGLAVWLHCRRVGLVFLTLWPLVTSLCMLYALAPDIPRIAGAMDLYNKLSHDPRCDIFLWHYSLDLIESDSSWYTAGVLTMAVGYLFVAWRELQRIEGEKA